MYAVIENTPGYMPENDDPPTFDEFSEALNYLHDYRKELMDAEWAWEIVEGEEFFCLQIEEVVYEGNVMSGDVYAGFHYTDIRKTHDLGRVVEIVEVEE